MSVYKNRGIFNKRYYQIVGFVAILMIILAIRLFVVTVIQGNEWSEKASTQSTKTIYTSAPRGNIYDKYGRVIATNKQIFTVIFNVSSMDTDEINDSALTIIDLLKTNGDKYIDNFPIKISSTGNFYYTYDNKIKKWLEKQGFSANLSASQAFSRLRTKYGIDTSLDRYEALEELQTKHNISPPITVKTMTYTYDQDKVEFLTKFGFTATEIEKGISAKQCFDTLRKNYKIDKNLSDKRARKIFIVRNEIATNGFTRYNPITIAKNVSDKTIAYISEANIPGVEISSETERYYPNGTTACHILGYMGAISESETSYYVDELGYTATDLIGKDGIESSFEQQLHGTPGIKTITVNSAGEYVSTVSKTDPEKGEDVYLSIDLSLQKTAESSLKKAINKIGRCNSGAVVAMDVKTGEVLAMASYPTYDPNIFSEGITTKAWNSVQSENPRDNLSPAPLYNNATRMSVAPGSTFKPITAVTALECGLNPQQSIVDHGHIDLGDRQWGCSAWNDYRGTHGSENLEWGLGNSCNYYFFCIATGKDWGTGASLGYSQKISVDKILKTAKNFGLGEKTGIELGESVTPLASAERKINGYRMTAWNTLYENAHTYFPEKIANDYDKLTEQISAISDWIYDNPSYDQLVSLLREKTDIKEKQVEKVAGILKYDIFNQAQWTTGDQFNISIGQGDNAYTPLQLVSYISTLGNGGVKNPVTIISGVENEGKLNKDKSVKLDLKDGTIDSVITGMKRVCTSGTLAGVFGNFPISVAGKTGTAENQGIVQPKSEVKYIKKHLSEFNSRAGTSVSWNSVEKTMKSMMNENPDRYPSEDDTVDSALKKASKFKITQKMIDAYKGSYDYFSWTVALAPADDPQIAVAVLLVQGGLSSNAAPVAKDVIADYLDVYNNNKKDTTTTTETGENKAQ